MSRRAKVLTAVAVVLVLLIAGGAWYLNPLAPIATGYAAKSACSGELLAGRSHTNVEQDLPPNPLVPALRVKVAPEDGSVRATLLGLWGTSAYYTEGLGCTVADQRPDFTSPEPLPAAPADAAWPQGEQVGAPPDTVDTDALAATLDAAFAEDDPDGRPKNTRAVVVVHAGRIVAERYADGFGPDTPQLGWSMSKSVANAITGRLVQAGTVALDDDHLSPQWPDGDPRAAITVTQLLQMTPGLEFNETYGLATDVTEMLYAQPDAGAYAADKPLEHDPGTHWQYSSGNTNILCDHLQDASATGVTMARDLVFAPLGMRSAVMEPDASGGLVCSSYVYATPRDWARFGQWFLQDGEWGGQSLLPADWVDWSTTPVDVPTDDDEPYGASWWLNRRPDGSRLMPDVPADAFWADGHDGQRVVVIPSADVVVVRMGATFDLTSQEWGFESLLTGVLDAVR